MTGMKLLGDEELPVREATCIAIGNFDGCHIGHTRLFETAKLTAEKNGWKTLAWSFREHPENILSGGVKVKGINSLEEKAELISRLGVELAYFADFEKVRDMTPEGFVGDVLCGSFGAAHVVCGFNFTFGKNGAGNVETLSELLGKRGVGVTVIPPVTSDGVPVSSSLIRRAVEDGDMEKAAEMLGRHLFISFPVGRGKRLGRTIGAPTVNQNFPPDRLVPGRGVYAVKAEFDGKTYCGVSNVGVRPTVSDGGGVNCETHILDFSGELLRKNIRVIFLKKLRDEKKFPSLELLAEQIARDVKEARTYFGKEEKIYP